MKDLRDDLKVKRIPYKTQLRQLASSEAFHDENVLHNKMRELEWQALEYDFLYERVATVVDGFKNKAGWVEYANKWGNESFLDNEISCTQAN